VRLACVKHAASVRSEPGSNSQVHLTNPLTQASNQNKGSITPSNQHKNRAPIQRIQKIHQTASPSSISPINHADPQIQTYTTNTNQYQTTNAQKHQQKDAANISLPQQILLSMNNSQTDQHPA
jgi:hypothetical protein